ncbi:hypothetical protein SORBI_3009G107020 [Sorghum bicolor]|uniref:Uncharacterized protein n=1 Tax=Sorghum bicolor TaxID=4558 RepID=A0A1Z5R303_SORBI|nr:hypothetical protein SORBI_3009G107020 [Sorghum bicolor]
MALTVLFQLSSVCRLSRASARLRTQSGPRDSLPDPLPLSYRIRASATDPRAPIRSRERPNPSARASARAPRSPPPLSRSSRASDSSPSRRCSILPHRCRPVPAVPLLPSYDTANYDGEDRDGGRDPCRAVSSEARLPLRHGAAEHLRWPRPQLPAQRRSRLASTEVTTPLPRATMAAAPFPIKVARHADPCFIHEIWAVHISFCISFVSIICFRSHQLNLGYQF